MANGHIFCYPAPHSGPNFRSRPNHPVVLTLAIRPRNRNEHTLLAHGHVIEITDPWYVKPKQCVTLKGSNDRSNDARGHGFPHAPIPAGAQ